MNVILLNSTNFLDNGTAIIDNPSQIAHIRTVLRSQVGDCLKIGCLGGLLGVAVIDKMDNDKITLNHIHLTTAPPPKLGVTVILALPRPKVMRRLVMDMVAIGVNQIILINSYASEKSYWQSPLISDEKLQSYVLEGLQQGVDTAPIAIVKKMRFKPFVEDELASFGNRVVVAHPYANGAFDEVCANGVIPDVLVVGAEGGFTPYEIDLLTANGAIAFSVGKRILRTESAVNVLLGRWL